MAEADPLRGTRLAVVSVADNAWQPAELVELAVIHVDDGAIVRGPLVWTVRPEHLPAPQTAQRLGVPLSRVTQGPQWADVAAHVTEMLSGRVLVAYDLPNTYRLLQRHLPDWRPPRTIDLLALARIAWPELRILDLPTLLIRAGGDPDHMVGRSPIVDATATATVLLAAVRSEALPRGYLTGEPHP